MPSRVITSVAIALLVMVSGCSAIPGLEETTIDHERTTTESPSDTPAPGTQRATHVVVIESDAESPAFVSLTIRPDGRDAENRSFVLDPGQTYAVEREYGTYRVSLSVDNRSVVGDRTVQENEQLYARILKNGSVEIRTITV